MGTCSRIARTVLYVFLTRVRSFVPRARSRYSIFLFLSSPSPSPCSHVDGKYC
jgi:hypothetical protein